ncbi:hypothetical protein KSS87_015847, partial [Heliosperma pusillum]
MKCWNLGRCLLKVMFHPVYDAVDFRNNEKLLQATPENVIIGSKVWVEDPQLAWVDGEVSRVNGTELQIQTTNGKSVVTDVSKVYPKDEETPDGGVDDMTKLAYLHEPGVLSNLAVRYSLNEIY